MKKYICQYKEDHPKATIHHIRHHIMKLKSLDIGKSTVGDILKAKQKWLALSEDSKDLSRNRKPKHQQLEDVVFRWFTNKSQNSTIKDEMIIAKAKELGEILDIKNFSYSQGWLYRFKRRKGIKPKQTASKRRTNSCKIKNEEGSNKP